MTERVIKVTVDPSGSVQGSRAVERALKGVEKQAEATQKDVNKIGGGRGGGGGPFRRLGDSAKGAQSSFNSLRGGIAGVVTLLTAGQIIRVADEYAALQGQLKLVTNTTAELEATTTALFNISQETRQSIDATASLYIRLARSTDFTSERIENLTSTISKTVALSRAAPQAAQAALFQLGQGFAAGALRGEELNSVLEQTPELAKAIADGLEITTGELRLLGAEGELTAEVVADALEKSAARVNDEFGDIPLTVGDATTRAGNALKLFIGNVDQASGATSGLASIINGAAQAIQGLAVIVGDDKGFGAEAGRVGEQIEELERDIKGLQNTVNTGFRTTRSNSQIGGFQLVAEGAREEARAALQEAVTELERLKQLQLELIANGGLTNAEVEARRVEDLKNSVADIEGELAKFFSVDAEIDQFARTAARAQSIIEQLGEAVDKDLITREDADRLSGLLNDAIGAGAQREADAFVAAFDTARLKAEAQIQKLDDFVAENLIDDATADRIRSQLEEALVLDDPAQQAADKFVEGFRTALERAEEQIDQLDDFIADNLIDEPTATKIRARLEAIVAKELEIEIAVDVQALQDTEQRIADLQDRIAAFNEGGAEGLAAFDAFIEARDIIAELGDNATVTVQELTQLIATEAELEKVLEQTTSAAQNQTDELEDFFTRARENSQDILAGFLADPLAEGLDELPGKFAQTLQQLAAQALASKIFELLLGSAGGGGGGFFGAVLGAFGGGRADGGPVAANDTFLVGERGPELFTPGASGNITSNEALTSMAAPQVNVAGPTIVNAIDPNEVVAAGLGANGGVILNQVTEQRDAFRQALGITG